MRRTRRTPLAVLALLAALALLLAACGGGDDDADDDDVDDTAETRATSEATKPEDTEPDDTEPDDTEPDDTEPDDTEAMAEQAVASLIDSLGLPVTDAQAQCLTEELTAEFDVDELEELRDSDRLSADLVERAAPILDLCLPLDDVVYLTVIAEGLTPAQADCVAEAIADEYDWEDLITLSDDGACALDDVFAEAGTACGVGGTTGTSGSTVSVPTVPRPTTTTQGSTGGPGGGAPPGTEVSLFDSAPGECWLEADFDTDEQVYTVLDCAQAHDQEIGAVFELPDGAFPGTDAVQQQGSDGCIERFEDYVGHDYASSQYYVGAITPTEQTWNDTTLRDREVLCVLYVPGATEGTYEETTGSAYQSGL